jgi:hypothetical protein
LTWLPAVASHPLVPCSLVEYDTLVCVKDIPKDSDFKQCVTPCSKYTVCNGGVAFVCVFLYVFVFFFPVLILHFVEEMWCVRFLTTYLTAFHFLLLVVPFFAAHLTARLLL